MNLERRFNLTKTLLLMAVFITIIGQTPFLRIKLGISTQLIAYPIWLILLVINCYPKFKYYSGDLNFVIIFAFLFFGFISIIDLITNHNNLNSKECMTFISPILISLLMIFIGYSSAKIFDFTFLKEIAFMYILATTILSVDVFFTYLINTSMDTVKYAFSSKNSVGQMIVTSVFFLFFMFDNKGYKRIIKWLIIFFLLLVLVKMRSRASIVSLALLPIIYIINSSNSIKKRSLVLGITIFSLIFLIANDTLYNFIVKNVILNTPGGGKISFSDLNRVSSNRFEYFETFSVIFPGNELMGIGPYYMDNMFLNAIGNYGIFVGALLIMFAFYPVYISFMKKIGNTSALNVIRLISCSYLMNGFFEALAPFGPGAKCFILWILTGVLINKKNKLKFESN